MNANMPKVFVINLERNRDRREYMARQLTNHDIPFVFYKGADGGCLSSAEKKLYSSFKSFKTIGRDMHPNEIGCALSHIYVWKTMIDENIEEALIFEDDVCLSPVFKQIVMQRHDWLPDDWGVLNLAWDTFGVHEFPDMRSIPGYPDHRFFKFHVKVERLGCYLINKRAAKRLTKLSFPLIRPSDSLAGDLKKHQQNIYGVMPRIAKWDEAFESATLIPNAREEFVYKNRRSLKGLLFRFLIRLGF